MPSELKRFNLTTISLVLLTISLGYWQEWLSLFQLWNDSYDYTHGFLVFFVTLWLLYTKRHDAMLLKPNGWWIFLPALLLTAAAHLLAKAADVKTVATLSLPCFILFSGMFLYGKQFFIKITPTLSLLFFALPVWDDIAPLLQRITVFTNQILLSAFDIPAIIRDLYITIPQGTFFVAGGCSGSRYLLVAMFISNVYGILYLKDIKRSLLLFSFSIFFSMLANWIRVFGIIYAGYQTNMQSSLVNDHEVYGWIIFAVVCLLPVFITAHFIEKSAPDAISESTTSSPSSTHATATPSLTPTYIRLGIAVAIMLISPTWISLLSLTQPSERGVLTSNELPVGNGTWKGPLLKETAWKPRFHNADLEATGVYINSNGDNLQLSVNWYVEQHQGKELVYYDNHLFDDKEWTLISSNAAPASIQKGIAAKETILRSKSNQDNFVIIYHWYQIGPFTANTDLKAKLFGAIARLTGRDSSGLLAIAKYCSSISSCQEYREELLSLSVIAHNSFK
ncbi:exosortase A [Hahella sp. NBU794]|uniref:exosortase A n=1 Tax=Hahella sp. NBU794 TaxID=3422590 RepID=UPI003D6FA9AE